MTHKTHAGGTTRKTSQKNKKTQKNNLTGGKSDQKD
jgi:hypothetical protein